MAPTPGHFVAAFLYTQSTHANSSYRLEEFLRRRARLQRVEEEVRRRVVVGFFNTL